MSKKSGAPSASSSTQRLPPDHHQKLIIDAPIDAEEYLRKLMASNRFSSMVDEFMSRFGETFEVVLKEKDKDEKVPTVTAKVVKVESKPEQAKTVAKASDTERKVQSGEKYDLVTVKNDKMAAGFLLPKNDKAKVKTELKVPVPSEAKAKSEPPAKAPQVTETAVAKTEKANEVHQCDHDHDEDDGDEGEWGDVGYPPKPRNFLEAALYFSTVTLGTVSMANQLSVSVFFAPPILPIKDAKEFTDVFGYRRSVESKGKSPEYEAQKLLQRRISALFAVALSQSSPSIRPFASSASERLANTGPGNLTKTNYLKRSIGFFAVSLVDHLPSSMASRLFKNGADSGGLGAAALGLDDLRVPSPETLGSFWLGMDHSDRVGLVQAEIQNLSKGWISSRKTWCMCRYCKHRRLRLSDIFDHVYRAYHDELVDLDCCLRGVEPPAKTPHQLKIRKLLYKALTVVAEDILNTKSRLMLEAISRLGRAYHEESLHINCGEDGVCWAEEGRLRRRKCHCPDCDYYYEGAQDDEDEYDDEEEYSDYDDLDIDEDGDFYEDFNYGEDDEYIQLEGDNPIDEAQLPSTLPSFYDMDLMWSSNGNEVNKPINTSDDPCVEGQSLFEAFINQIFQFHLVPTYLEHQALEKQKELLMEEEEAEKLAKIREEQKHLAKKEKKERQKAAKAAQKAAEDQEAAKKKRLEEEIAAAAAKARAEEEARIARQQIVQAKKKEAAAKKKPVVPVEPVVVPKKPVVATINTSSFVVEDIAPVAEEAHHGLSKSAKRKKKKAAAAAMETESTVSSVNNNGPTHSVHEDLPPGLFAGSFGESPSLGQSPVLDPPPPYSIFDLDTIDESLLEPLEPADSMTADEPTYLPVNLDVYPHHAPPVMGYQRPPASQSRFENLFSNTAAPAPPGVPSRSEPSSFDFQLFNRPPFNRRFMQEPAPPVRQHDQSSVPPGYGMHDHLRGGMDQRDHFDRVDQRELRDHRDQRDHRHSTASASAGAGPLPTIYQASRTSTYADHSNAYNHSNSYADRQFERLSSANDPMYRPPPPSYDSHVSTPVVAGQEGFNPFEDWSPVRSSLFSRPLFNEAPQAPLPHQQQQQQPHQGPGPIGNSKRRF